MNPILGWALAVLAIAVGYTSYGWQGVLLGLTVVVFWLLLQFNRTLRVMRKASDKPLGSIKSAVMFQAKLKPGMKMIDLVTLAGSLGERRSEQPEVWRWHDDGGDAVLLTFEGGVLARWTLERAAPAETPAAGDTPP